MRHGQKIRVAATKDGKLVAGETAKKIIGTEDCAPDTRWNISQEGIWTRTLITAMDRTYLIRDQDGHLRIVEGRRKWEKEGCEILDRCPSYDDLPENVKAREEYARDKKVAEEAGRRVYAMLALIEMPAADTEDEMENLVREKMARMIAGAMENASIDGRFDADTGISDDEMRKIREARRAARKARRAARKARA